MIHDLVDVSKTQSIPPSTSASSEISSSAQPGGDGSLFGSNARHGIPVLLDPSRTQLCLPIPTLVHSEGHLVEQIQVGGGTRQRICVVLLFVPRDVQRNKLIHIRDEQTAALPSANFLRQAKTIYKFKNKYVGTYLPQLFRKSPRGGESKFAKGMPRGGVRGC